MPGCTVTYPQADEGTVSSPRAGLVSEGFSLALEGSADGSGPWGTYGIGFPKESK